MFDSRFLTVITNHANFELETRKICEYMSRNIIQLFNEIYAIDTCMNGVHISLEDVSNYRQEGTICEGPK